MSAATGVAIFARRARTSLRLIDPALNRPQGGIKTRRTVASVFRHDLFRFDDHSAT
jgi:hypothetical protein